MSLEKGKILSSCCSGAERGNGGAKGVVCVSIKHCVETVDSVTEAGEVLLLLVLSAPPHFEVTRT